MHPHQALRRSLEHVSAGEPARQASDQNPGRAAALRLHDGADIGPRRQQSYGEHKGYRLIECGGEFFAVLRVAGPVCLADEAQHSNPWIFSTTSLDELRAEIDQRLAAGRAPVRIETFGCHEVFSCDGRFHAVPEEDVAGFFGGEHAGESRALAENSLAEARRSILKAEHGVHIPGEILGTSFGYALTRMEGRLFAFPLNMHGAGYLPHDQRAAVGVLEGNSIADIEHAIARRPAPRQVEFAGWLPVFQKFGNCGAHPQFAHTNAPPAGYAFIQSPLPSTTGKGLVRWKRRVGSVVRQTKINLATARLVAGCMARGAKFREAMEFVDSRDVPSQLLLPRRNRLLFLTSVPYTLGQDPWVIEIEDLTSLFFPYVDNGRTADLAIEKQAGFLGVKTLLEMPNCRGIITHIRATAEGIAKLFQSESISRKTTHVPLGIRTPGRWQRHQPSATINLLFTNSWHQAANSFYLRGGLEVLEAFSAVHAAYPELRLTLRTSLPADLPRRYARIIEDCSVVVLDAFLPDEQLDELLRSSHIFLLPSARIHIMSVLQAMAYGMVPVVSDGWGMTEYVEHGKTGLIVRGRYGKVAWNDETNGMLREHYAPMRQCDVQLTQFLVDALSQLADEPRLRQELGQGARHEVESNFSLARWNVGLKRALDRAWTGE